VDLARRRKPAGHASLEETRDMAEHLLAEAAGLRQLAQTADAAAICDALGELAAQCDAVASLYLSSRNGREMDLRSSARRGGSSVEIDRDA